LGAAQAVWPYRLLGRRCPGLIRQSKAHSTIKVTLDRPYYLQAALGAAQAVWLRPIPPPSASSGAAAPGLTRQSKAHFTRKVTLDRPYHMQAALGLLRQPPGLG